MPGFLSMPLSAVERRSSDLLFVGAVFLAYTITVWVALDLSFGAALLGGAANTVPVMIFGALARHIIVRRLIGKDLLTQALGHIALCTVFSLLSFWLLIVLLGLVNGSSPFDFSVRSFSVRSMAWQSLENVTIYAMLASLTYARRTTHSPLPNEALPVERSREPARYFVRSGEDMRPIDLGSVVCIGGADDYVEVTTLRSTHLVRMTLSEFERTLDPAKFIRVHRSWIVNLDHVERAEPAGGGRMLVHMKTGKAIPASRSGTRGLRERVI